MNKCTTANRSSTFFFYVVDGNDVRTYFLSSRLLSTCEQWYWKSYTDIIFKRAVNLTYVLNAFVLSKRYVLNFIRSVKRNPCPCSYSQALSDFRFYKLNSENRLERSNSIACFVPLNLFLPQSSDTSAYQQVNIIHRAPICQSIPSLDMLLQYGRRIIGNIG